MQTRTVPDIATAIAAESRGCKCLHCNNGRQALLAADYYRLNYNMAQALNNEALAAEAADRIAGAVARAGRNFARCCAGVAVH